MELFSERDLQILAQLEYSDSLKPVFDPGKYCLTWADEYSLGLSREGDRLLNDLWTIRGYLHFSRFYDQRFFISREQKYLWTSALAANLPWHGLKRLLLKPEDELFLKRMFEIYERPSVFDGQQRFVA